MSNLFKGFFVSGIINDINIIKQLTCFERGIIS
jgi:hypothetical protein